MAFLEWRKFNFFDLEKNVDNGNLDILKDVNIKCYTFGNGYAILCDTQGSIYFISRSWKIISLKGYESSIDHVLQIRQSSLLITVGEDDPNSQCILIKIWDTSKLDKNEIPVCLKTIRRPNSTAKVSAICANLSSPTILVLGMSDGTIWLRRGDFTRDRGVRIRTLKDVTVAINGLAIRNTAKQTYLFTATAESVFMYNISVKDKEYKVSLDSIGCKPGCSILADTIHGSHFMIARDDAIYCYTPDGRGPCYAISSEKVMLDSFRGYLIIISKDEMKNQPIINSSPRVNNTNKIDTSLASQNEKHMVTVLDIQNKFIVFTAVINECRAIINEWGGFYLIDSKNSVYHLNEKDLQSKLNLLFKKNLYDVAIRIAKSQQYDADSLIDIFRQYGDYLYTKGDHVSAVGQYIKTIGKLEASYVIRKFLDSQYIDKLTMYLQALHKSGIATEDHTTLLLNCYTKLNHTDKLKEFILNQDKEIDFDIDIAIKVCRQVSVQDALTLAVKYSKHDWCLRILIEDFHEYGKALAYLTKLFDGDDSAKIAADMLPSRSDSDVNQKRIQVLDYFKKYALLFIENVPGETTEFLKMIYKNYSKIEPLFYDDFDDDTDTSYEPDQFLPIFVDHPEKLVEFLEYLFAHSNAPFSRVIYDTLIENYLCLWHRKAFQLNEDSKSEEDLQSLENKLIKILQSSEADYDKNQALILCQTYKFKAGILFLYEDAKLYQQILQYLMRLDDETSAQKVISYCKKFGHQEPNLWLQALWYYTNRSSSISIKDDKAIEQILDAIVNEHLLSPLLVLDALSKNSNVSLGLVRKFLSSAFEKENAIIEQEYENIEKHRSSIGSLREHIKKLRDEPTEFRSSRCALCNQLLELPTVHFMCQHSFHQHCFQSFSESEMDCPACMPNNRQLLDKIKLQQTNQFLHETFHSQLERADDSFTLLSEYFGRGVFNKITVLTSDDIPNVVQTNDQIDSLSSFEKSSNSSQSSKLKEPIKEGRLRLQEGSKFGSNKTQPTAVPMTEGQMRMQEQRLYNRNNQQYSKSFDTSSGFLKSQTSMPISNSNLPINFAKNSKKSSKEINPFQDYSNPFEDDDEENSAADQRPSKEPGNPFGDDDNSNAESDDPDYDKNLNPFA